MRVVVGTDHAGFCLKQPVLDALTELGCEIVDVGVDNGDNSVDFPDYATLAGRVIQNGEADRGILLCGSGVGVSIAANKLTGIRASTTHDTYSAHQGVEHDGMNVMCLGGRVIGSDLAKELVRSFVGAQFQHEERFIRRLDKINRLESTQSSSSRNME